MPRSSSEQSKQSHWEHRTNDAPPQLLAAKLRQLRQEHKLTLRGLASQIGLASHTHLVKIEMGHDPPSLKVVILLAEQLSVSLDYLLRDSAPAEAKEIMNPMLAESSFGERLRALREDRQLTPAELGKYLHISRTFIINLEANRRFPSIELAIRMADFFGVSIDSLFRQAATNVEQ